MLFGFDYCSVMIHYMSLEALPQSFLTNPQGHTLNKLDTVYWMFLYSKPQGILLVMCYVISFNVYKTCGDMMPLVCSA